MGGNWSSISAHSCRRSCRGDGAARAAGSAASPIVVSPRTGGARGRGWHRESGSALPRQPLGASQGTVLPFFSQAGLRSSRAEVCVHTGHALGTAPGRRPLAGGGRGALTELSPSPSPPLALPPPSPPLCLPLLWRAVAFLDVSIQGACASPGDGAQRAQETTPRSRRETPRPPPTNPALLRVTPEWKLAVSCLPSQASANVLCY